MKRRAAIQHIGWGLSGGILMPSLFSACGPKDPGPEIVYSGTVAVIGAGAAGLYVADILNSKGIKVIIFEARDQIGGRIRSLRNQPVEKYPFSPQLSSDFPIELGAQTIVGTESIFGKIFKDYNLKTTEFAPENNSYVLSNQAKSGSEWAAANDADFQAANNFRAGLKNYAGNSQSVQQLVQAQINARAHGMLNGLIGNAYGSSNDKIGIGALAEQEALRQSDGKLIGLRSNPLQDTLISRFSAVQPFVRLNTPIVSIAHATEPATITAKDGTVFEANKVVVTVPVSILKNGSLNFSPALPGDFTNALAKFSMGGSLRVILEFKKNFWGNTVGYILGSSNVPEYFSIGMGRSDFNRTLSITINGEKAAQYAALDDDALTSAILADLDLIYAGQGTQFIRKDLVSLKNILIRQDWTKEEYMLGGYAYPLPGARNDDRKAIGQPLSDRLFFAGEATDISGQAGMVNGALASAERAALEVINVIKKG